MAKYQDGAGAERELCFVLSSITSEKRISADNKGRANIETPTGLQLFRRRRHDVLRKGDFKS